MPESANVNNTLHHCPPGLVRLVGRAARPLLALAFLSAASSPGVAAEPMAQRSGIGLEGGAIWFARNDARIPGDTGTDIDLTRFTGSDPRSYARIRGDWHINPTHSLHLVYAPLEAVSSGQLEQGTDFEGERFTSGEAEATYRFNAYKLTYRYTFASAERWRWGVGFTGVVRDAEIALRQGGTSASNDNVGFVPALHLTAAYRLGDHWALRLDFDGLAGGPGRLFDVAIKLDYELSEHWQLSIGYRTLEGGADTDEVYNFAWLNYAASEIRFRF